MNLVEKYLGEKPKYKSGDKVKVPHKGKLVTGKIVRYDKGDKHGWPYYVIDVGEYESIKVPVDKVRST